MTLVDGMKPHGQNVIVIAHNLHTQTPNETVSKTSSTVFLNDA